MRASAVSDGGEVMDAIARERPDLPLLDVMLPHRDGMSLLRDIRAHLPCPSSWSPRASRRSTACSVSNSGPTTTSASPTVRAEVVARVKAILRRAAADPANGAATPRIELTRRDARGHRWPALDLTRIEFKLLEVLSRHPGRVYRRDQLLDLIYDDFRDVSDRTIDSHVKNLRRKLEAALPERPLIHSVYGVGYRFEVP